MAACGSPATNGLNWPRHDAYDQSGIFVQEEAIVTKRDFKE